MRYAVRHSAGVISCGVHICSFQ